ncbi:MAG: molecular chaperone DnaJ, partial [Pseudomonadota bacterium]
MTKPDPFGFDMSVSSAKKKNPRGRRGMSGASETSTRICDHDGCNEPGKFRAPKAPDVLDDFFWFCQQHVREYNTKWNFFDGTTEAEINAQQSKDKVWERQTKPMGDPEARAWARLGIEDPHQVLGKNATQNPGRGGNAAARRLPPTEKRAIEIL